jgi:hypothetical protein
MFIEVTYITKLASHGICRHENGIRQQVTPLCGFNGTSYSQQGSRAALITHRSLNTNGALALRTQVVTWLSRAHPLLETNKLL